MPCRAQPRNQPAILQQVQDERKGVLRLSNILPSNSLSADMPGKMVYNPPKLNIRSNPLTHRNILRLWPALLAAIFIAIATAACAGPDLSGVEQGIADNAAAIEELRPAAGSESETPAAAQAEVEALLARLLLDEVAIAELRQEMDSNRSAILAERRDLNELLDRLQLDEAAIAELRQGLAAEHAALVADEALIAALSDRLDLDEATLAELRLQVQAEQAAIDAEQEKIDALLAQLLTDEAIIAGLQEEVAVLTARVNASIPACGTADQTLNIGFYPFFEPLSYSAESDPAAAGFNVQRGYEADLLDALAAMDGPRLTFVRTAIPEWEGIWLKSADPEFDLISGGITILESRTRDAEGALKIAFTRGHVHFRQSLLVRAEDADRIRTHADLTGDMKVGVLAGTTGEHRLLQLLGLVDGGGALIAGVRVDTPAGTVTADGSMDYYHITAAEVSPNLVGRTALYPPTADKPTIIYLGDELGEAELLAALVDGSIDATARGEIGNQDAAGNSGQEFAVTALDPQTETGGFTVAADNAALRDCLNQRLDWLTDNRRIGYGDWRADPQVFMRRAQIWNAW